LPTTLVMIYRSLKAEHLSLLPPETCDRFLHPAQWHTVRILYELTALWLKGGLRDNADMTQLWSAHDTIILSRNKVNARYKRIWMNEWMTKNGKPGNWREEMERSQVREGAWSPGDSPGRCTSMDPLISLRQASTSHELIHAAHWIYAKRCFY